MMGNGVKEMPVLDPTSAMGLQPGHSAQPNGTSAADKILPATLINSGYFQSKFLPLWTVCFLFRELSPIPKFAKNCHQKERDKETERDRERQRQRERESQTETQRNREQQREREQERQRVTEKERESRKDSAREREHLPLKLTVEHMATTVVTSGPSSCPYWGTHRLGVYGMSSGYS